MSENSVAPVTVQEAVAKGVAYLNREHGREWVWNVDLLQLDMECSNSCILGQMADGLYDDSYDGFDRYIESLPGNRESQLNWAYEHGFYTTLSRSRNDYCELAREWQSQIAEQRSDLAERSLEAADEE